MSDIKIIFEDSDLLVIDKPTGIIVNRSETAKSETLQDWIETKFSAKGGSASGRKIDEECDFYKRSGIVHRIDKETSGILIIAKNQRSFENLQKQFKERVVDKTYIALAHGKLTGVGEINIPVGRLPWNRTRFGVLAGGREAFTKYKVLSNLKIGNDELSLLEAYPRTGRTHQIRVHLKYLNHPIFADELYAGRKTARADRKILPRLFLHAKKISFLHPTTRKRVEFESDLPQELKDLIL